MKLHFLYSFAIFWLGFVASNAALSPEIYWKVKLPNTPIPKVIKDFLPQPGRKQVDTEGSNTKSELPFGAWIFHDATEDEIRELKGESPKMPQATTKNHGKSQLPFGAWIFHDATKDEIRELKGRESSTMKTNRNHNFLYKPFFFESDLEKGKTINFPSLKTQDEAPFWPRQIVESIPFSSKKVQEILSYFSIESSSRDAQTIKETIKSCEDHAMRGENKTCATSLESMVDFIVSTLGTNNIEAITTIVEGNNSQSLQKYTIKEVEEIANGVNMICHKLQYPYAVHFCHGGGIIKTFKVSMIGVDGTKVKALSVCLKNTSLWNPKGLPFVVLEVKPGETPICHFLKEDQVLFLSSKQTTRYL